MCNKNCKKMSKTSCHKCSKESPKVCTVNCTKECFVFEKDPCSKNECVSISSFSQFKKMVKSMDNNTDSCNKSCKKESKKCIEKRNVLSRPCYKDSSKKGCGCH
jgi:hypothetical protein